MESAHRVHTRRFIAQVGDPSWSTILTVADALKLTIVELAAAVEAQTRS
jgi:hypothetical protein